MKFENISDPVSRKPKIAKELKKLNEMLCQLNPNSIEYEEIKKEIDDLEILQLSTIEEALKIIKTLG